MMRLAPSLLFTLLFPVLLSSCASTPGEGGAPPTMLRPFIDRPGGSQIHYRDEDSNHIITLREDGTYRHESSGMYGGTNASREGGWGWGKLGSHAAELVLDEEKLLLQFVDMENAIAVNEAAGRTHAFQFVR